MTIPSDVVVTRQSPSAAHCALAGSDGGATVTVLVPTADFSPTGPIAMPTDIVEFAATRPHDRSGHRPERQHRGGTCVTGPRRTGVFLAAVGVEIDPALVSEPCGMRSASGQGRCVDPIASDVIRYVGDQNSNRLFWVDDADVIVHATSVTRGDLDLLLDDLAPVLASLELHPTT